MSLPSTGAPSLADRILQRIDELVRSAEAETKPLELEPFRGQLFELFVTAEGAGYLADESPDDLTADGLCRVLGERWGLADAARGQGESAKMSPAHVAKMRLLWSVMRMWMEWTDAWRRWPEFHADASDA
jgi:hypothetical protein